MKLRDYQNKAEKDIKSYLKSDDKAPVVIVQPCGAGKSLLIAVAASLSKKPVLVLQPSKELLEQNYGKFTAIGGEAYIYSASVGRKEVGHTTYGTPQSLKNATDLFKKVDVVIIDECHYNCSRNGTIHNIIKKIEPKKVIGLTATPCMLEASIGSSKLMMLTNTSKSIFKKIIHVTQVEHLVKNGYWSRLEYFQEKFDDSMLRKNSTGNEYTESSIIKAYESNDTSAKIVETFNKMSKSGIKHILIFVPTIAFGEQLEKTMKGKVKMVHGETKKKEREKILTEFKNGEIKGVISVDVLTTGFDFPALDGIICARSTNSFAIYYQMLGRGVRIHENKDKCTIVDLCGMVKRFGKLEDIKVVDLETYGFVITTSGDFVVTGYDLLGKPLNIKDYLKLVKKKPSSFVAPTGKLKHFWFGKHRGVNLNQVPATYIRWMLNNNDFNWYFNPNIERADVDKFKKEIENILTNEQHRQIY